MSVTTNDKTHTKTIQWETEEYSYHMILAIDKMPVTIMPPDDVLEAMARGMARELRVTPENEAALNAGSSWTYLKCTPKDL